MANVVKASPIIVFVAVLASLLEIIDSSIVNVALPTMMGNLGATLEDISMVITGYTIANAVVLPVSAWLGERFGRRPYYLGCILLFTAASVACGVAPNLNCLIVFRILQGLAGGALLPTSQTLIYEQFPPEKAGIAGAIFGMSVMIGPALGPVLGGWLTDNWGWRSIFNVNLPLGLLAFFMGMGAIYNVQREKKPGEVADRSFDAMGLALLVAGVGCLQFVLERGEADDWFSSRAILINAIIAAISLPSFVLWELRVKNPIINVRLFKNRIVVAGVLLMSCLGFFLYGAVFILPIFITRVFHYDATQIGLLFIPGSILTAMMMPLVGRQMQKGTDPRLLIFIGLLSIEICAWMMTGFSPQTNNWEILKMLFVRGFALAFLFVPINSSILSQFTGPPMGQVAGLLNLFRQIGGSIGIALIATLLSSRTQQNYVNIVSRVSAVNQTTQQTYFGSKAGMLSKLPSQIGFATAPSKAAFQAIYYRIQNQAFMLSFLQLIYVIMFIFALSFLPLLLLRFKKKVVAVMDAH
jgi:MFS transporter, DHA2 family, multidrug resistance protein